MLYTERIIVYIKCYFITISKNFVTILCIQILTQVGVFTRKLRINSGIMKCIVYFNFIVHFLTHDTYKMILNKTPAIKTLARIITVVFVRLYIIHGSNHRKA